MSESNLIGPDWFTTSSSRMPQPAVFPSRPSLSRCSRKPSLTRATTSSGVTKRTSMRSSTSARSTDRRGRRSSESSRLFGGKDTQQPPVFRFYDMGLRPSAFTGCTRRSTRTTSLPSISARNTGWSTRGARANHDSRQGDSSTKSPMGSSKRNVTSGIRGSGGNK